LVAAVVLTAGSLSADLAAGATARPMVSEALTHHVDAASTNAQPPYLSWSTAASNIQDAVDAAADGDVVLVTNGTYGAGGTVTPGGALTNRIMVNKPITVRSVEGPTNTFIVGAGRSAATAPRLPFELIFGEFYKSKTDALRRESYLKTSAGKRALHLMLADTLQAT